MRQPSFTWKLRSVSFSSKTVEILNDAEITALLAHEVGHLYFAKEIAEARLNQDARASRLTELKMRYNCADDAEKTRFAEYQSDRCCRKDDKIQNRSRIKQFFAGKSRAGRPHRFDALFCRIPGTLNEKIFFAVSSSVFSHLISEDSGA